MAKKTANREPESNVEETPKPCVEQVLREIASKAAMLAFLADCAESADRNPEPRAFSGIGDTCTLIETLARSVHKALDVESLGREVAIPQQ